MESSARQTPEKGRQGNRMADASSATPPLPATHHQSRIRILLRTVQPSVAVRELFNLNALPALVDVQNFLRRTSGDEGLETALCAARVLGAFDKRAHAAVGNPFVPDPAVWKEVAEDWNDSVPSGSTK